MSPLISQSTGRFRQNRLQILDPATETDELRDHPKAEQLLAAWQRWRGDRIVPERTDVDVVELPALLEHLVLLDVEDKDFRFRLVGETIANRYAVRLKGKTIGAVMSGTSLDETLYEHRRCAEDRRAVLVTHTDTMTSLGDIKTYMRLLLPLGGSGPKASHIIGIMHFYR